MNSSNREKQNDYSKEEIQAAKKLASFLFYHRTKKNSLAKEHFTLEKILNEKNEYAELFSAVDPTENISLNDPDADLFFYWNRKKNVWCVNLELVHHRLNEGQDIRPAILENYLKDRIAKDTLISLFELQQSVNEFWEDSSVRSKRQPMILYPVHNDQTLSSETSQILIPYLMQSTTPYIKANNLQVSFQEKLESQLKLLPEAANFFGCLELPLAELYKIALLILYNTPNMTKIPHAKNFFYYIIRRLGFSQFNIDEYWHFDLEPQTSARVALEDAVLKSILKSKPVPFYQRLDLLKSLIEQSSLFNALSDVTLKETGEFLPFYYVNHQGRAMVHLIMLGSHIFDIQLNALLQGKSSPNIKKIIKFGCVSLQEKNNISSQGNILVGLGFPPLSLPKKTHTFLTTDFSYTAHDLRFHYPALFFLRVHNPYLFDLKLHFVTVLKKVTGHQTCRALNEILDFPQPFYHLNYIGNETIQTQIKKMLRIIPPEENADSAMTEYALILVCDLIKNEQDYEDFFQNIFGKEKTDISFITRYIFFDNKDYIRKDYQECIIDLANTIKKYPHSLAVFFCLLSYHHKIKNYNHTTQHSIKTLCNNLLLLEAQHLVQFKWNKYDGLMLNINQESFRFRYDEDNDYRFKKQYPDNQYVRIFSDSELFYKKLRAAVIQAFHKMETLQSASTAEHEKELNYMP